MFWREIISKERIVASSSEFSSSEFRVQPLGCSSGVDYLATFTLEHRGRPLAGARQVLTHLALALRLHPLTMSAMFVARACQSSISGGDL